MHYHIVMPYKTQYEMNNEVLLRDSCLKIATDALNQCKELAMQKEEKNWVLVGDICRITLIKLQENLRNADTIKS